MKDDIFSEDELAADATGADAEAQQQGDGEQQQDKRARDDSGRFVSKQGDDEGDEGAGEEERRGDGTVPQGALHAEREKRKAAEERERAKDTELAAARETLAAIQKQRDEIAGRKPEALPDAEDPAAMEHLRKRLEEQGQQINRFSQQQDMQATNEREIAELGAVISASEAKYRETQPDYDEAINHVVQARANELALYGIPAAQIPVIIADEAKDIVKTAVAQGRDPAELGYQIALSRGYRPAGEGQQQNNGKAAETLAGIAAARAGSQSLGSAAGSNASKTLNAEAIAAMGAEEFEALYSTPEGRRLIDAL